jgi:hypothetical protein
MLKEWKKIICKYCNQKLAIIKCQGVQGGIECKNFFVVVDGNDEQKGRCSQCSFPIGLSQQELLKRRKNETECPYCHGDLEEEIKGCQRELEDLTINRNH